MNAIDHAIERFREEFPNDTYEGFQDGYHYERHDFESFLRQTLTDFAQEVESKVIDLESEYPDRIWSKSLLDVDLGIARDGLETFKKEQRQALHHLIGEKEKE